MMLNATYCPRQRNAALFLCCEESSQIIRSSFVHGQRKTVGPKYSTNDSVMRWNPVHQQTLTNCCSFVKTCKVASCLLKERRLSGQPVDGSWQRAAGWELSAT